MKQRRALPRTWAITLALILTLAPATVRAQEQITLHSIRPGEGRPGQELDLTLRGRGFGGKVSVTVGEMEAYDVRIDSDQIVRARISIPEHAQPGLRDVEVVVDLGGPQETFRARLAGAFAIVEAAGTGEGGRDDDWSGGEEYEGDLDWLWWVAVLGTVGLVGATVVVAVAVRLRRAAQRSRWQAEAQEQELPETCRPGAHRTVREKPEIKPGRWKAGGLQVTLYDAAGGRRGETRDAPPEIARRIDGAARNRLVRGDSAGLSAEAGGVARELAAMVVAWQSLAREGRDVYLEPRIEGGEASVTFKHYRCTGSPGGWQKVAEWTAKLQAIKHLSRTFRGPAAGEDPAAYRAWLEARLASYVGELIREMGRIV
jgi:hypothetical protein